MEKHTYIGEDYREDILDILSRCGILTKRELVRYLVKKRKIKRTDAVKEIESMGRKNEILMSKEGEYTVGDYAEGDFPDCIVTLRETAPFSIEGEINISEDKVIDAYRLEKNISLTTSAKEAIECFWIILRLINDSDEIIIERAELPFSYELWNVSRNYFVKICYYPKNEEEIRNELIKNIPQPEKENYKYYRYIAVIEDSSNLSSVEALGFSYIFLIEDKKKNGECESIVLKSIPKEERWKDLDKFLHRE